MTRVARLTSVTLALAITAFALTSLAAAEPAASLAPPSLSLKDAPVQEVLRLLAKAQGLDIMMTDDVTGSVSLELSHKTPEQILDLVAGAKGLHWWKEGGVYVVSGKPRTTADPKAAQPAEPLAKPRAGKQTAVIQLEYHKAQDLAYLFGGAAEPYTDYTRELAKAMYPYGLPGQRLGQPVEELHNRNLADRRPTTPTPVGTGPEPRAGTAAAISQTPYQELAQQVFPGVIEPGVPTPGVMPGVVPTMPGVAEPALRAGPLSHLLPEDLSPPVALAQLNALIVEGTAEAIEEFRRLVEMLDVRVPQVMVEAQFVEMRIDDARQFGINWSWLGGETTVQVTGIAPAAAGGLGVSFVKGRFAAALLALIRDDRARIINAPRLATMNNQPVTFTLSQVFFYFLSDTVVQTPVFAGSQVFTTSSLNALPVVTTFTILPQVNGDGSITVDVVAVLSDIAGFATGPEGQQIPQPTSTALPTRMRVENGETIVIGGFVRRNVSLNKRKVPLLSDIPILGPALFTGTSYTQQDSELLIFLTAHVMEERGAVPETAGRIPFMTMPLSR